MTPDTIVAALNARAHLHDARHETAFRLFNGFTEGAPDLAIDLYARTAVVQWHGRDPCPPQQREALLKTLRERLPFLTAVVLKEHHGPPAARNGVLLSGIAPDRKVREYGVWYALDLMLNRDASLYLDTRNLRLWLKENLAGRNVLNTFAYTGSLGVAAMAGGALHVVQLDRNREFLNVAKTSYTLNGFAIHKPDFVMDDFFAATARLRREGRRFDCVLLDPPFFSTTSRGTVDTENSFAALVNKVRPLINHTGWLVAINNALFVSGADFEAQLDVLCADGYMALAQRITVPQDMVGMVAATPRWPADPAPYNHPTKIAVLRVTRKDVP